MESNWVAVLLVDETASDSSHLVTCLRNLGCLCSVSRSLRAACTLVSTKQFDIVLSHFVLHGEDCHELSALLLGRPVSLFYFYAVEGGCWWIPRICQGQECQGEPALRPSEFASAIEKLIKKITTSAHPSVPLIAVHGRVGADN
jgi:hypothetical protein